MTLDWKWDLSEMKDFKQNLSINFQTIKSLHWLLFGSQDLGKSGQDPDVRSYNNMGSKKYFKLRT